MSSTWKSRGSLSRERHEGPPELRERLRERHERHERQEGPPELRERLRERRERSRDRDV